MSTRCEFISPDGVRSLSLKNKNFYEEYLKRTIYYSSYKESYAELITIVSLTDNNFMKEESYQKLMEIIKDKYLQR